jgi:flagellar hook protein FlgE
MSSALWIGTTGLTACNKQMDVIGNNLANSNTVGYKAGDTTFASMLSQSLSGGSGGMQVGQGVSVAAVSTQFAQGSFQSTGNATDLAIDGEGFFILKDEDGLSYYTRAGNLNVDKDGYLTDLSHYLLQGRMFNIDGTEQASITDVNLLNMKSKPNETSSFVLGMNLNADAADGEQFNTTQAVYGANGTKYNMNVVWTRDEANNEWDTSGDLSTEDGLQTWTASLGAAGLSSLSFDAAGTLLNPGAKDVIFNFDPILPGPIAAPIATITWDLNREDAPDVTSYAIDSRVSYTSSDGYPAGLLSTIDIGKNGVITGYFTNGQQQDLARVIIANFTNPGGLNKVGSYFMETGGSGTPNIGNPETGGLGGLQSHSLEISNVDVASEFIKMIAAQRAYQASARIITTADAMLQELMNIKR